MTSELKPCPPDFEKLAEDIYRGIHRRQIKPPEAVLERNLRELWAVWSNQVDTVDKAEAWDAVAAARKDEKQKRSPIETELIEALQYIRDNVSIVLNISEKRAQLGGIDHKEIAKQDGHLTGILQKAGDALEKAGVSCP